MPTQTILKGLKNNPYLGLIASAFRKYPREIYLVGGALRDLFLKRKKAYFDFDFAVSSGAIKISQRIACELKSGFVVLDKEHGSTRVVYKNNGLSCNFDFTDFRGRDISEDLLHRDFTVNSMAVDLRKIKKAKDLDEILLDPFGARKDIKAKKIRMVSRYSIPEDPVRIMRSFSLSAQLGFKIEPNTLKEIKKYKSRISSCAFERITEELFKIFDSQNGFKALSEMESLRILDEIIPEIKPMRGVNQGPYHHLDVYKHSLQTTLEIENLFSQISDKKEIQGYLNSFISGTRTRRALLKLAALLHDIGKPRAMHLYKGKIQFHGHERVGRDMLKDIALRLRISNGEKEALSRIIFWHLRPGYLADIENLSARAVFRFFRDAKDEAPAILLLSIADQRSTRGPLTRGENRKHHEQVCLDLAKEYFRRRKEKKLPKLINGHELMKVLKLESGPLIGKILLEIEEAQAAVEVKTKAQALALARDMVKGEKK